MSTKFKSLKKNVGIMKYKLVREISSRQNSYDFELIKEISNFYRKIRPSHHYKPDSLIPVAEKYGVNIVKTLLSAKIFNINDDRVINDIISILIEGINFGYASIIKLVIEMIENDTIDFLSIIYVRKMGYDFNFTINVILQFPHLLKFMCHHDIANVSEIVDKKILYTFFRQLEVSYAEEAAMLLEELDYEFINSINSMPILLSDIL